MHDVFLITFEKNSDMGKNIHEILRSRAAQNGGKMSFRDFSEIALFDPEFGYYRRARERVGRNAGTDFYTAESLGGIFGKLMRHAAQNLLGETENLRDYTLVEIGAEPGQTHFENERQFFREIRTVRVGENFEIPEKSVVVANELLDAQPFHRIVSHAGTWIEIGVEENPDAPETWRETRLDELSSPALKSFAEKTAVPADDGWHLDISLDAETLLQKILGGSWRGAAIFPDYGKTLADCLDTFPEGTARAYFRHTQSNALTQDPGERDLTCHVLWDRLRAVFDACGFRSSPPLRQESFFMKYALRGVEEILTGTTPEAARERGKLVELIHPAKMGHAFQVLCGVRK